MAVCLEYQMVYRRREARSVPLRTQIVLASLLLFALAYKVWLHIASTDLGYQLSQERSKTVELDMQRRELELQFSILMRPDNLRQTAEKRLGLVYMSPAQMRKVTYRAR